jgi:signal transduction histidine kinase
MQERRRTKEIWKTKFTFPFFVLSILWVLIFSFLGFSSFLYLIKSLQDALQINIDWVMYFVWFVIILSVAIFTLFICMSVLLFRSVGAIPRIEKILDKVINGDYSQRISIRRKDTIHSLVDRMNQVIALLEQKSKS